VRRRSDELRQATERLLHESQKAESLGVLAGGVAHDFNNLLVGVLGNASLAMQEAAPGSGLRAYLAEIEIAGRRAAELANQMLAYSGKGRFVLRVLDLTALAAEMGKLLTSSLPRKVALRLELERALASVRADPTQMRQVIMNLVLNGADAIGDDAGVVRVSTLMHDVAPGELEGAIVGHDCAPGRYVELEVTDTGCGMDASTLARIFDPFFTTKFTGRGLGLSAVLGIVRGHFGAIEVHSRRGAGSTFRVLLPAVDERPSPPDPPRAPALDWKGSGLVLVADDEPTVRDALRRMLGILGFQVLVAHDGAQALAILRARSSALDLVLLDLNMPVLSGEELLRELGTLRPDLPAILMSGFDPSAARQSGLLSGRVGFLKKPFQFEDLRDCVRVACAQEPR
jgi:nitrogen-specific signal transduction histidine kinase